MTECDRMVTLTHCLFSLLRILVVLFEQQGPSDADLPAGWGPIGVVPGKAAALHSARLWLFALCYAFCLAFRACLSMQTDLMCQSWPLRDEYACMTYAPGNRQDQT